MLDNKLSNYIDTQTHPLDQPEFARRLHEKLNNDGVVVLHSFLQRHILEQLRIEAADNKTQAFYTESTHNVYLTPKDASLPQSHIFNRQVESSKGCMRPLN